MSPGAHIHSLSSPPTPANRSLFTGLTEQRQVTPALLSEHGKPTWLTMETSGQGFSHVLPKDGSRAEITDVRQTIVNEPSGTDDIWQGRMLAGPGKASWISVAPSLTSRGLSWTTVKFQ